MGVLHFYFHPKGVLILEKYYNNLIRTIQVLFKLFQFNQD